MERYVQIKGFDEFDKCLNDNKTLYNKRHSTITFGLYTKLEIGMVTGICKKILNGEYYYKEDIKPLTWYELIDCAIGNVQLRGFKKNESLHIDIKLTIKNSLEEIRAFFIDYDFYRVCDIDCE